MRPLAQPRFAIGRRRSAAAAVALLAASTGCYSFSSYQSARLLEPGQIAMAPSVNRFQPTDEKAQPEDGDWSVEGQLRAGIASQLEIGLKLSRIFLDNGYQFVAFDPKLGILPNRVAVSIPVGTFFGNDIDEELQLHPTLILTQPLGAGRAEVDLAAKAVILYHDRRSDLDEPRTRTLWGFNVGCRFDSESDRWAVHPELGVLIDDEEPNSWVQLGIGVWIKLDPGGESTAP